MVKKKYNILPVVERHDMKIIDSKTLIALADEALKRGYKHSIDEEVFRILPVWLDEQGSHLVRLVLKSDEPLRSTTRVHWCLILAKFHGITEPVMYDLDIAEATYNALMNVDDFVEEIAEVIKTS